MPQRKAEKSMGKVICITGIDTDIGKSVVTGLLAKYLYDRGKSVITQKLCQTGCEGLSTDILTHRNIMGIELVEEDYSGITCPYVFAEPASPHLAAKLEKAEISLEKISETTQTLSKRFDYVILEGVGGLLVPLTADILLVDYLKEQHYRHILVSCSRLGSINHTLSALEILQLRGIELHALIYNTFFDVNPHISTDSREIFTQYLPKYGHRQHVVEISTYMTESLKEEYNFSMLFSD